MGRKLDPDATRSDKLLKLYRLLLLNDRKYTTVELTEKLDCSKQTVRAIVDTLNSNPEIEISEEYDEKRRSKSYYIEHHKSGYHETIALDGFRQMELCRDLIGSILPEEDLEKLNLAIFNAANYLPRQERLNFKTLSFGTGFQKGIINYSKFTEQLHDLMECIKEKKSCILEYQKFYKGEIKDYSFAPQRLLCMHDCFYILGWITDSNNPSVKIYDSPSKFSVHRIQKVRILDTSSSAQLPEIAQDSDYFGLIDDKDVYEITVKFTDPYAITYVADREWSSDQKISLNEDGSLLLTFKSRSYYETLSFICSFGSSVEIISPESFREDFRKDMEKLAKVYGII